MTVDNPNKKLLETGVCPLCMSADHQLIHVQRDKVVYREFMLCAACGLVFVPSKFHITATAQIDRYRSHNNDPNDPEYRAFLSRLFNEMRPYLVPGATALDYGCGPGPALAAMLREAYLVVSTYDPYFDPDESSLKIQYDFVTCTETVEHFTNPVDDFKVLDSVVKPGGLLGVMTGMLNNLEEFPRWYYHRDPTHICFYTKRTMSWIANRYGWKAVFPRDNVVLFKKENGGQ